MTAVGSWDPLLKRAVESFGTPAYVYLTPIIEGQLAALRSAFGTRFALSYAVKTNPNPALLTWLKGRIELLDVSSLGELRLALQAGWDSSRISFTGPGKRDFELDEAIRSRVGELVLESVAEARAADAIAAAQGTVQPVLVRIAPDKIPKGFGDHMAGKPTAFGIDEERVAIELPQILTLKNLRVVGLHIYAGTQCLRAPAVAENLRNFMTIFSTVCTARHIAPDKLVFGSGFGVPYHDNDQALDLEAVAGEMTPDLDALSQLHPFANTRFVLELGRYLVSDAGFFLTRVVRVKSSRGSRIAICDGGLNNHLAAAGRFGMVIHRNYVMHKLDGIGSAQGEAEKVDLAGPLCTSIDRLARDILLPRVEEGDVIAVHASGGYGLTASPLHFISHTPPREILIEGEVVRDVSRRWAGGLDPGAV